MPLPRLLLFTLFLAVLYCEPLIGGERCPEVHTTATNIERLKYLVAREDPQAMLQLAALYSQGECVPQDRNKARALYKKLARKGHPEAEFRLGLIYLNGFGVKKNFVIAEDLFRRAIAHGHPHAREFLDYLNEEGFDDC
jgi:TPR repeat protein